MSRAANAIYLAEDGHSRQFLHGVLKELRYRPEPSEGNAGVRGEQGVRNAFPLDALKIRNRGDSLARLLVMIDADKHQCGERRKRLRDAYDANDECKEKDYPEDRIAILVPKWQIETWIFNLTGGCSIDENAQIRGRRKEDAKESIREAVLRFVECVREPGKAPVNLPCLTEGIEEFRRVFSV